ncbi:Ig-like domain-containing protein [Epilithonimonas hungarica]|nr:Ig-like domain-containing protein [Epilithonimonas hungarica]
MNNFFKLNVFGQSHRKHGGIPKLQFLLFVVLLFAGMQLARAQCNTVCNSNYGFNSNNDAATIEYDNIISASVTNAVRESDGTFKIWGYGTAANGSANLLSPTIINSTNYPGLQGTVLKVALGGTSGPSNQSVLLTTEGLYAWGTAGNFIPTALQPNAAFGRVNTSGSTYGLPPGVEPQQVKSLMGTQSALALLTCSGETWVLTKNAALAGAGLTTANNNWNRVTISAPGNPTLDNVIAFRGSMSSLMALRADGTLWTWGVSFLGDGTATTTRSRAEQMTLPNASGTIKMIGMANSGSYYVLYTDGNLYSMGNNSSRELGDWTTTTRSTWIQPRYNSASGAVMNNIKWISPTEHHDSYPSINVLTTTEQVYNWGHNYQSKLRSGGGTSSTIDPGSPTTDRMLALESGGAQTIVIKACTQNFGFAGNQYYGSMGDGSNTINVTRVPYNYSTAPVNVCGANAMVTTGAPVFNADLPTSRCQGAGTETYTATASGGTVSYSLSPVAAGSINASTGAVTYNASWSGTAEITATATGGCGTPETTTFTVTVAATPATPVFNSALSTQRCTGAGTVTYTATSSNADSITYSIANTGTGTQPTINPTTGEVTYAANWSGTSTITATASGCSTTASSTFTVSTAAIQAVADAATGPSATPLAINVLTNDLCSPDPTTLTIVTQPVNGTVQIGTNGNVTYLPNGDFAGTDTFVYKVCNAPAGVCSQATVTVTIAPNLIDVCSTAGLPKTFYLPFPENAELKKALMSAGSDAVSNNTVNARRIIGIRANYSNTLIYYDHWEDGYEPTAGTRTQTTTEIWGDGNTSNGVAPGYPTDIFPEGAIITIDNNNAYRTGDGRTPTETTIQYDGRDKIYSTKLLTLTKVTGSDATFSVQNTKGNVIDTNKFGRLFVVPFGENISSLLNPNIATTVFDYTSLFVRASENGTIVQLDYNGDGVVDVTSPTLAEGMVWFYEGTAGPPPGNKTRDTNKANDIKSGAVITSNKPVGVDLVFGGIDNYGTRNIPLLPGNFYGSTYYSPVYTTLSTAPVYAVFTNSLNEAITVNWKNGLGGNGSIIIPAKGYTSLEMNQATAYKFESVNGKSYTAVTIVDADANGLAYDWAFNMIPGEQLTNFTTTAWAPGMASAGAANPVWITPTKSTTVYVKYTGSVISTAPGLTSPCGLKYDVAYTLSELQAQKVFTSTGNSGMSFFTCDGTPISAVYGQDSSVAAVSGATTLDAGFTLDPQCIDFVIFANDDQSQTYPNIPVTIDILNNDVGRVSPTTVAIVSQPTNGTVVVNPDGTVTYTPNPGFSGTDTFNYQVCNSDRSLCSTAVVTVNVGCLDAEMKHILTGKIFDDANKNGTNENGESGIAHTVNLYLDANGNGVLDTSENTPVESVTTNNTGAYVFDRATPIPTTQASNDFATASYSAGTGWSTNWIEEGETTSATAGNIQIAAGELRITGNTAVAVRRSVNAPITNALLSFDYRTANLDGLPYKTLLVEVAPSATGPWTTLGSLYSTTGYANGKKIYNIPASVVNAGTAIRFRTTGAGNHFFYIDNVAIQSIPTVNYIVQLAEPLPANRYQTLPVLPQKGYAVAFNGYKTSCSNNFGLAIIAAPACYKPGITSGTALDTKVGISALGRAGETDADNWPMARKGGHIALESKTKAFVPNRVAFSGGNPVGIAPANFVEGMMVYDITNKCLKVYTQKEGDSAMAWHCVTTQACPD